MQHMTQTALDRLFYASDPYEMIFAACDRGTPNCLTMDWILSALAPSAERARP